MSKATTTTTTNVATDDQDIAVGTVGYLVRTETRSGHASRVTTRYHLEADTPVTSPGGEPRERGWLGSGQAGNSESSWYAEGSCVVTAVHRQEWDEADEDGREVHVSQVVAVTVEQHPARMEPAELREIRDVLGMSGADLALSLGVRHDQLRKWESGGAPIPYGVARDLIPIAEARQGAIAGLVARLRDR